MHVYMYHIYICIYDPYIHILHLYDINTHICIYIYVQSHFNTHTTLTKLMIFTVIGENATSSAVLQCNTLQHSAATHCKTSPRHGNTLQHTAATRCNAWLHIHYLDVDDLVTVLGGECRLVRRFTRHCLDRLSTSVDCKCESGVCVAVCRGVSRCVAVRCSALQCESHDIVLTISAHLPIENVRVVCVLQGVAVCCTVSQSIAVRITSFHVYMHTYVHTCVLSRIVSL